MANTDMTSQFAATRRSDERQAQALLVVVYPFCLVAAGLSRLTRQQATKTRRSIFAEAHASAAACIPFAFR